MNSRYTLFIMLPCNMDMLCRACRMKFHVPTQFTFGIVLRRMPTVSANASYAYSRFFLTVWEHVYKYIVPRFWPKNSSCGCLTNAIAPPLIALESCSRAQMDQTVF